MPSEPYSQKRGPALWAECLARCWWEQCSGASLPLRPIGQFGMSGASFPASSISSLSHVALPWKTLRTDFPPAQRRASVEPLHLPRDYNQRANGAECSSFCFCMLLLLSNPSVPLFSASQDKTHRLNEHASLCFLRISSESRVSRDLFLRNVWRWEGGAVCLCVALLDMMRDDIMVDAAAAVAARWGRIPFVSRPLRVMCLSVTLHNTGHRCSSK